MFKEVIRDIKEERFFLENCKKDIISINSEIENLLKELKDSQTYFLREEINKKILDRKKSLINQETEMLRISSVIQALENNAKIVIVEDQLFNQYSIADFSTILAEKIIFNENDILTLEKPNYIPLIDEKHFSHFETLDTVKIDKDKYIICLNQYKTNHEIHIEYKIQNNERNALIIVSLDQLVLIIDYYICKAKANENEEKKKFIEKEKEKYFSIDKQSRINVYNDFVFYEKLPSKIKSEYSREQWNMMTVMQKEEIYIPISKFKSKKVGNFERRMNTSYHLLLNDFMYKNDLGRYISTKKSHANNLIATLWKLEYNIIDRKIIDLKIQRENYSYNHSKAIETSFGMSNTDNTLYEDFGVLVKRQNGDAISLIDIEQIKNSLVDIQKAFGSFIDIFKEKKIIISHSASTYIFASKAIGMYVGNLSAIGVSNKYGKNQFKLTLAHELGHFIDNYIGKLNSKRFSSDNYDSLSGIIASTFRENLNDRTIKSEYLNSTIECFARAFEQYFGMTVLGDDVLVRVANFDIDLEAPLHTHRAFVSKENFYNKIKPLIDNFLIENKHIISKINIDINDQNNIIDEINQLGESFGLNDNKENLKDKNNLTDVLSIKIENWQSELEFCDNESEIKALILLIKINKIRQENSIDKLEKGGKLDYLAPNGKPSNLSKDQYKLVRTNEFKQWFGDWENNPENASKVVDENFEPLVVYHGTFRYFNTFEVSKDSGFYFVEFKRIAEIYANYVQEGKLMKKENNVRIILPCFLNLRNPNKENLYGSIVGRNLGKINKSKKKKYDGLILKSGKDVGGDYDQIIAFNSNQIKLADGTNTTFDSNNDDIRYADGGIILEKSKLELIDKYADYLVKEMVKEYYKDLDDEEKKNNIIKQQIEQKKIYFNQLSELIELKDYLKLIEILHLGNETSRKFFNEYTNEKLPKTYKGTYEFLKEYCKDNYILQVKQQEDKKEEEKRLEQEKKEKFILERKTKNPLINYDGLTPIQIAKLDSLLDKKYRFENDKIMSFRERINGGFYTYKFLEERNYSLKGKYRGNDLSKIKVEYCLSDRNGNGNITFKIIYDNVLLPTREEKEQNEKNTIDNDNNNDKNNLGDVLSIKIENWQFELEFCDNESEIKALILLIKINKKRQENSIDKLKSGGKLDYLAPNGKPSNLSKDQYKLVRTNEFKQWFGDWEHDPENASKVVDENGEPLVVYHGTENDFNIFNIKGKKGNRVLGYFFTDNKEFSEIFGNTKKYFINIRKIKKYNSDFFYKANIKENYENNYWIDLKRNLVDDLYDGIVILKKDSFADQIFSQKDFGAFYSNQIKLADGTNTTFDSNNDDIRYADGGEIKSHFKTLKNCLIAQNYSDSAKGIIYKTQLHYKQIDKIIDQSSNYRDQKEKLYLEKCYFIRKAIISAKKENVKVYYDEYEGVIYFEFGFGQVSYHLYDESWLKELKNVIIEEHKWSGLTNSRFLLENEYDTINIDKFLKGGRINSGYTEREDGSKISIRGLEAENEGTFTKGFFKKVYNVSLNDFNVLILLDIIVNNEWHHTNKSFSKMEFFSWKDSNRVDGNINYNELGISEEENSFANIYKKNKKEISAIIKQFEKSQWEYKRIKKIPLFGYFCSINTDNPILTDSEESERIARHNYISNILNETEDRYSRKIKHSEVDDYFDEILNERKKKIIESQLDYLKEKYNDLYEFDIKQNENVDTLNKSSKGKEYFAIKLLEIFNFSYEKSYSKISLISEIQINNLEQEKIKNDKKRKLEDIKITSNKLKLELDEFIENNIKNGDIKTFERLLVAPDFSYITKSEMNGKYGWFKSTSTYNMKEYYSGLQFKNKEMLNYYTNELKKINDLFYNS